MSLTQQIASKHNRHNAYSAKQVLANEAIVAKNQKLAMYVLMERAGTAVFEELQNQWSNTNSVLVICGKGNNGGDGFISARLAYLAKMKVTVLITCDVEHLKGDALTAYQAMLDVGVSDVFTQQLTKHIEEFSGEVIIDALFGIGFYGDLGEPMETLVSTINQNSAKKLSIDIPSGLCATTGSVSSDVAVVADVTVTFIVFKQGLLTGQAANYVGELILADIGLGHEFSQLVPSCVSYQQHSLLVDNVSPLKKRLNTSHKGNIGQVLAIGGGKGMPGAIRLAGEASLRCGAALVSICCDKGNQALVFNGRPEFMLSAQNAKQLANSEHLAKANVLIAGPGLGQTDWSKALIDLVLLQMKKSKRKWLVLDADGLSLLANTKDYCSRRILTPHPKEAAKLLGCNVANIEADRFSAVKNIAKQYGGICILKGAGTLISNGHQTVVNSTGNSGMASGGMGDVLAGVVAALTLQAQDYFEACCLAVYIHGAAGDIIANKYGQRGMLASDLFLPLQKLVN